MKLAWMSDLVRATNAELASDLESATGSELAWKSELGLISASDWVPPKYAASGSD